jgi:hypothetical protein
MNHLITIGVMSAMVAVLGAIYVAGEAAAVVIFGGTLFASFYAMVWGMVSFIRGD